MGALCGHSDNRSRDYYRRELLTCVEAGNVQRIQRVSHRLGRGTVVPFSIDEPILVIQEVQLNSLCYAFRLGHTDIVRFLLESQPTRLEQLYSTFGKIGKTPMDFVCEYGFLDLLQYFLPLHLAHDHLSTRPEQSAEHSLFDSVSVKAAYSYSTQKAVHRACEKGRLVVIVYLHEFFEGARPPTELDVHVVDEGSGENCALISARTVNLEMMQYLHEVCRADFRKCNLRGESALQLAVSASKRITDARVTDCIVYLVETVKVSVQYEYEETLLLCERADVEQYLEARLLRAGIARTKQQVEAKFRLARARPDLEHQSQTEQLLSGLPPDSNVSSIAPRSSSPHDSSLFCDLSKH